MPSGPMAPNSRQRNAPHEPALNQPRSAFGGTCVPAGTEGVGNLEVVPAGDMHRALHIEMPHLLNAIMRRSCIETTAERTMNPAVDHFCRSGLTPCPRLKNGRLDRIIRLKTVLSRTGLSRSTIYRKIAEGTFPAQLKISTHGPRWHESDINLWTADPVAWRPKRGFDET
jgi:prophage regulatory protein